jgi:hypothetical protein
VSSRPRAGAAILAIAAAALGALGAGCGSSGSSTPAPSGVGPAIDVPIRLASCSDWKQANVGQRLGTIKELQDFAGGTIVGGAENVPSGRGAVLDQQQAYDLLDGYCKNFYARGFRLYKLYEHAAAFAGEQQK